MEAEAPTIWVGATTTELTVPPYPHNHRKFFLQARCPSCRPTNSVKAVKAHIFIKLIKNFTKILLNVHETPFIQ